MYANANRRLASTREMFRWTARASAAVLMAVWFAAVLIEIWLYQFEAPPAVLSQAIALAVVFAGYAIGWRKELAGGLIAILGTISFVLVNLFTTGTTPPDASALFVVPGMLFVAAWISAKSIGTSPAQLP